MPRRTLPLLWIMAYAGNPWWRPAAAQSSAMVLVSLAPPVSQTDSSATSAATDSPSTTAEAGAAETVVPAVLYPSGQPIINNIDTVLVSYTSPWDSVDLTVQCERGGSQQSYQINSLQQTGVYNISPIGGSLEFRKYPQTCSMLLNDASDAANSIEGGTFTMTSTKGKASMYGLTATQAILTGSNQATETATATAHATTTASTQGGTSSTQLGAAATSGAAVSAATSSSNNSSDSSSSHSGLSSGAKVGIAFAVIIILALFAVAAFFFLRQRRRLHRTEAALVAEKEARESERAYNDNILKAAGKPDTAGGGRIVVTAIGSRNSSSANDWKGFFASKANSAKNSAREVAGAVIERAKSSSRPGSRRFSRMSLTSSRGSKRNSRPATAADGGEDGVPSVPSLPAMSYHGSTTNLVRNGA